MSERVRREIGTSKSAKLSALERLKKARSGEASLRDKVKDEDDVYDVVDEDEYSELVQRRQKDDWIVNDGPEAGYYEDGREIFEDYDEPEAKVDDDEEDDVNTSVIGGNKKKRVPLRKPTGNDQKKLELKKKTSIKSFFGPGRKDNEKKFESVELNDEDLLNGILDGINSSSSGKDSKFTTKSISSDANREISKRIAKRKLASQTGDESTGGASHNPFLVDISRRDSKKRKHADSDLEDDTLIELSHLNDVPIKSVPIVKSEPIADDHFDEGNGFDDFTEAMDCLDDEQLQQSVQDTSIQFSFDSSGQANNAAKYSLNLQNDIEETLDFVRDEAGNRLLNFFWLDAYEDAKEPGVLYLFGKVFVKSLERYVSCCLICQNIERKLFVYPRSFNKADPDQVVTMKNVDDELRDRLLEYKVKNFRRKTVNKLYSFDKDIVPKADYMEVLIDANRQIPADFSGDTFRCVFAANQSAMERFLLELRLKGPCWLSIRNPESSSPQISWCKAEFLCKTPFAQISTNDELNAKNEIPPLTLMTISLKTYMNPNTKQNEIISLACLCNREFHIQGGTVDKNTPKVDLHFCILAKPSNSSQLILPYDFTGEKVASIYRKTKVEIAGSEREALNLFLAKMSLIDPDILVGHDIYGFDMDTLLSRMAHYKIGTWSKFGRIKKSGHVPVKSRERVNVNCGRMICDVMISSKELIKAKSYDLTELTKEVLKKPRQDVNQAQLVHFFENSKRLLGFIDLSIADADHIMNLMLDLNILPLALQITKIAGNLFSRTLLGGRSERNEFLLLHAFHEANYIVPDKAIRFKSHFNNEHDPEAAESGATAMGNTNTGGLKRKKAAYSGGLVLDPKVGFYDKYILLMDFNSLYPSIIQEYNICFTTVDRKAYLECIRDETGQTLPQLPEKDAATGILPVEISRLVNQRREVKRALCANDLKPNQKVQLDIKQKALKLTANSMYGCLGFSNSRFYAKPLAALITSKGREILSNTKQLAESLGLEVIYGDTDSIMINTNCNDYDEARKIGTKLQSEINRHYKLLEIEIDGVFRSILLLKKKKYAAVTVTRVQNQLQFATEVKGLDIVRRDWSNIARKVGEYVLNQILAIDKPSEQILDSIHSYLRDTSNAIREKQLPLAMFVITKQLTKNPEDYPDSKSLSHVLVALRRNQGDKMTRKYKSGDTIPYVVCVRKDDPANAFNTLAATQRAFHVEELKDDPNLEIDANYYLQSQIHPIVSRLCDPIDGTNTHVLAEFLGIEAPNAHSVARQDNFELELLNRTDETRYDTCRSLYLHCPNRKCGQQIEIRSLIRRVRPDNNENDPQNGLKSSSTIQHELTLTRCEHCSQALIEPQNVNFWVNQLHVSIRTLVNQFYLGWMTCEDPICKHRTRNFAGNLVKRGIACPECRQALLYPDISDVQMHLQLSFYAHILNVDASLQRVRAIDPDQANRLKLEAKDLLSLCEKLVPVVNQFKCAMAYDEIDLDYLFNRQYFSSFRV